jgi:hypothetical protein
LAEDIPLVLEPLERSLHRGTSDARTELKDLCLGEHSQGIVHWFPRDLMRGARVVNRTETVLKVPIAVQDDAEEILDYLLRI